MFTNPAAKIVNILIVQIKGIQYKQRHLMVNMENFDEKFCICFKLTWRDRVRIDSPTA